MMRAWTVACISALSHGTAKTPIDSAAPPSPDAARACDELTPDLCLLEMEQGSVQVRNLTLVYWIYYDKNISRRNVRHPLITVHGGPAIPHNAMLPLKQIACRGRKVVFYDQIGCGRSDRATREHAPWLYTIDYYVEELSALIRHLAYKDYHVLGHSWGSVVSQLFAETRPAGLHTLTLSSPRSSQQQYIEAQWDPKEGSLGTLPDFVRQRMRALEKHQLSDEYRKITQSVMRQFVTQQYPTPSCLIDAENGANRDISIAIEGPSEFAIGGLLSKLDITDKLPGIKVPTLLTSGEFDTSRPPILRDMRAHLIDGEWIKIPRAARLTMLDNPKVLNEEVERFMRSVEDGVAFTSEHSCSYVKESSGERSWIILLGGTLVTGVVVGYLLGSRSSNPSRSRLRTPMAIDQELLPTDGDCE